MRSGKDNPRQKPISNLSPAVRESSSVNGQAGAKSTNRPLMPWTSRMAPKHWIRSIAILLALIASISSLLPGPEHRIHIDATVRAISFETEGEYPKRIIEPLAALTFVVAGFDEFQLFPEKLE